MNRNITFRLRVVYHVFICTSLFFTAFTNNLSAQTSAYCMPSYLMFCSKKADGTSNYIKSFTIRKNDSVLLSNTTGCTPPPFGEFGSSYFHFNATTPSVASGITYDFDMHYRLADSVESVTGYSIWLDVNNDADFDDAGELLRSGFTGVSSYFTIPLATSTGNHRLRVRYRKTNTNGVLTAAIPLDPCATYEFGDTHDYTLNVTKCAGFTMTHTAIDVSCNGLNNGSIKIMATGGTGALSFSKDNGVHFSAGTNPFTFTDLFAANYPIIVKDSNNCETPRKNVLITEPTPLSMRILFSQLPSSCDINNGIVHFDASGGTPPYQFSKTGQPWSAQNTYLDLYTGTHTFDMVDNKGCRSSISEDLLFPYSPTLSLISKQDILCNGFSTGSIAVALAGGKPPYLVSKSINDPFVPTSLRHSDLFGSLPPQDYRIIAVDSNGCFSKTLNVTLTQSPPILFTIIKTDATCSLPNGSANVRAKGGATDNINITCTNCPSPPINGVFTNLLAGTYNFTGIDANDCKADTSITIGNLSIMPTLPIIADTQTICKNDRITLLPTGGSRFKFYDKNPSRSTVTPLSTGASYAFDVNSNTTIWITHIFGSCESLPDSTFISIVDTIKPTALCKTNTIQLNEAGIATLTATLIDNGSTDNCDDALSFTLSKTIFNCSYLGTNNVSLTVIDSSGNKASCSTTIKVEDKITPSVFCKPATIQLDATGIATLSIAQIENTATDNCSITQKTLSKTSFNCSNLGANSPIFTATDASRNTATCAASVTVEDRIKPVLVCKPTTLLLDETGIVSLIPLQIEQSATDNCGIAQRVLSKTNFNCSHRGINTVLYTVLDAFGNTASCSTTVTIQDKIAPLVFCKTATIQLDATGNTTLTFEHIDNGSTDNCGIIQKTLSKTAFNCANIGINSVVFTIKDLSGNTSSCSTTVIVEDKTAPSVSCKPTTVQLDVSGNAALTIAQIDDNTTDNCSIAQRVLSKTTFNCTNLGANTVIFTATDASGNSATCSTTVTVSDIIKPAAYCKAATMPLDATGNAVLSIAQIDNGSTDNCGITQRAISKTNFNCSNLGANIIIFTATDASGNSTTCTTTLKIEDKIPPSVFCKTVTLELNPVGIAILMLTDIDNNSTDNCAITQKTLSKTVFNCTNIGTNNVIFTATDASGNTATCATTVNIVDKIKPTALCKPATIQLDATGNANITAALIDNNSTDNCSITERLLSKTIFNCSNLGANSIILSLKDISGNIATCSANITVEDKISPSVICKPATIQLTETGSATLTTTLVDNNATDNCGITERALSKTNFDCSNLGTNIVLFTATDASGNAATCAATVKVEDKINPTAICKPTSITLVGSNATLTATLVDNNSTDNCGITERSLSKTIFNCSNLGTNNVSLTVKDASGNLSTCTSTVTVEDKTQPSVTCKPATISLDITGNMTLSLSQIDNISTDNCGITQKTLSKTSFDCSNLGTNTVVFTATDASGNSASCATTVKVEDKIAPSVFCKPTAIQLNASNQAMLTIAQIDNNSTDNCSITNKVLSKTSFDCSNLGINRVTFTATDASGNTATCVAIVTVEDKILPIANCKPTSIQFGASGKAILLADMIDDNSTDNCGVIQKEVSKTSFDCSNVGSNTVIFTATDASGNTATCSTTVTVAYLPNPAISCKSVSLQLDAAGNATLTADQVDEYATNNCVTIKRVLSKTAFDCSNIGSNAVTLTITDIFEHSSECTVNVIVQDNSAPIITCPANRVVQLTSGECREILTFEATATDNCTASPLVTHQAGLQSGESFGIGTYNISFSALDKAGNVAGCFFSITVKENTPIGNFACRNQINVTLDPNCSTKVLADWILTGNNYGCFENYTVRLMTDNGAVIPSATVTGLHVGSILNAIITSPTGVSCSSSGIRVIDVTPPTIKAPATAAVFCDKIGATGIPLSSLTGEPSILNECSLPITTTYIDQNFDIPCGTVLTSAPTGFPSDMPFDPNLAQNTKRIIVRTFQVADRFNNTASTHQVIYILNINVNNVIMPTNRSLSCGSSRISPTDTTINGILVQGTGLPILSNNATTSNSFCPIGASYTDVRTQNTANNTTTIQRSWLVVNTCTNDFARSQQTITITDAPPVLTLNQNLVFQIPISQLLTIKAAELINSLSDACSTNDKIVLGVRIVGTGSGFPNATSLTFDCDLKGIFNVEVWARDEAGNVVSRTTTFTVNDNGSKCTTIGGMIQREDLIPVPTNILLYNNTNDSINGTTGTSYLFNNLVLNSRFSVMPKRPNTDWVNGVTVFDVALVSRHILGSELLSTPYRLISADVNHNNEIDAVDMILMRRLVLRVNNDFQNNNSWRFVLKNYTFDDPTNPFASDFPETLFVPTLTTSIQNGDFVAIKIGDVNVSAGSIEIRGNMKPFNLSISDRILEKNKTYNIPIKLSPYQRTYIGNSISALQFALAVDKNAALIENVTSGDLPNCTDSNTALFKGEGIVTAAWNGNGRQQFIENDSFTVFNLVIKPIINTRLSQILSLNPTFTEGVAYDEAGNGAHVKLDFGNMVKPVTQPTLLANRPNPFTDETTIAFVLPEDSKAKLSVYDLMGRVLMTQERVFSKGLNEVVFDSKEAPSVSSGILVVQLQTAAGMVEQKIVLSR